ncbi:MAG: hypothetical protein M0011_05800 [Elusimicrobia bacterium]|nr:hypothetical protein [Elusimicrobiota bacterium]
MAKFIERGGQTRGMLLAGIAVLTVGLVLAMKFFMGDDTAQTQEQPPAAGKLFSEPEAPKPPELKTPQTSVASGGALDMFSKANAGYYGDEESTAAAAGAGTAAPAEVKKSTAAARKSGARPKAKAPATVIPRLKPVSFGGVRPSNVGPASGGQMPDISNMIKQAQEEAGKNGTGGN